MLRHGAWYCMGGFPAHLLLDLPAWISIIFTTPIFKPVVRGLHSVSFEKSWCLRKSCIILSPIALSLHDLDLKAAIYNLRKLGAQADSSKIHDYPTIFRLLFLSNHTCPWRTEITKL